MSIFKNYFLLLAYAIIAVILPPNDILAQSKKELDQKAIKSMAGCYDVEFKYTETFAPEIDYEKAYDYTSAAFEWAEIVEETDDKVVLQHLLIIKKDTNPAYIIKHWRQDWVYEANENFSYVKNFKWTFHDIKPSQSLGTWTQSVYQVDDSPRYSGTATWTHVDGISSWYNKADSPLPRREYSKRDDYNVMKRGNRVIITDTGWLHEQDNDKIIRAEGKDVLLVQEKGYNTYTKRPDADCQMAIDWWQEHKDMWSLVRDEWDEVLSAHKEIKLSDKVDEKRLYEHLFDPAAEWDKKSIAEMIQKYTVTTESISTKIPTKLKP